MELLSWRGLAWLEMSQHCNKSTPVLRNNPANTQPNQLRKAAANNYQLIKLIASDCHGVNRAILQLPVQPPPKFVVYQLMDVDQTHCAQLTIKNRSQQLQSSCQPPIMMTKDDATYM